MTSGSKGLHLYVPMDMQITSTQATDWARVVAEQIEKAMPTLVVSRMTKALRHNKILIDWSQNAARKTTVAPYSLRGRHEPTVAAPRTWAELAAPDLEHLTYQEVLERVAAGIDPLASLLTPPAQALARAVGDAPAPTRRPAGPAARPRAVRPLTAERPATTTRPRTPQPPGGSVVAGAVLPADLAGPVELELAKAEQSVPGPHAMAGGSLYELKWDGYRGVVVRDAAGARLWSRQRNEMSAQFPELVAAAAAAFPSGTVVDGEAVIWNGARLDFDLSVLTLNGTVCSIYLAPSAWLLGRC